MNVAGRTLNLNLLQDELAAAGCPVPALGVTGGVLHTYRGAEPAPLPPDAAAVVAAHLPPDDPRTAALCALRASADPTIQHVLTLLGLA